MGIPTTMHAPYPNGILVVDKTTNGTQAHVWVWQKYICVESDTVYERQMWDSHEWTSWVKLPTRAEVDALGSKTTSSLTITDNTITANVNNFVKANRVVTLSLQIKFDPAPTLNQEIIIGTIPSGYVPSQTIDMTMTGLGSAVQPTDIAQLWLLQNGDVRFVARNTPTTNWYRADITYII